MTFNANLYRAGASGAAGLAKKARHIFEKSYWKRTDDDIDVLYPIVDHLKVFVFFFSFQNGLQSCNLDSVKN